MTCRPSAVRSFVPWHPLRPAETQGVAYIVMKAYNWDELPWEDVRPGVRRKGFRSANALMVLNELQPGMEARPHHHPFEQLAYILKGRVRFTVGETVHELGPGGLCVIPPDVTHFADVLGEEPALNLDIFSPVREDYLHLTKTQIEYRDSPRQS